MNILKIKFKVDNLYPTEQILFNELNKNSNKQYLRDSFDKLINKNCDFVSIIYLNSHNIEFYGGSVTFNDSQSVLSIEPKAGNVRAISYSFCFLFLKIYFFFYYSKVVL
jgi:hypothetical protein